MLFGSRVPNGATFTCCGHASEARTFYLAARARLFLAATSRHPSPKSKDDTCCKQQFHGLEPSDGQYCPKPTGTSAADISLVHKMPAFVDRKGGGGSFEARLLNIILHRLTLLFDPGLVETWSFSDEVIKALRKWKLENIDEQRAYHIMRQPLGSDMKQYGSVMNELSSFSVTKYSLKAIDFKAQGKDIDAGTGLEKAKQTFVATLRNLVFSTTISSAINTGKDSAAAFEEIIKARYRYAACLLLDVLVDRQGQGCYWQAALGGYIVEGWNTKVSGGYQEGEDAGERGEVGNEDVEEHDAEDPQSSRSLTTIDPIDSQSQQPADIHTRPTQKANTTVNRLHREAPSDLLIKQPCNRPVRTDPCPITNVDLTKKNAALLKERTHLKNEMQQQSAKITQLEAANAGIRRPSLEGS